MKKLLLALIAPLLISTAGLAPVAVSAGPLQKGACQGLNVIDKSQGCSSNPGKTLSGTIKVVLNIISVVVSVVAIIMIIVAGLRYITSAGDAAGITAAKNTLIYAIVGLVIVGFAQTIVHFVLGKT